MQISKIKIVFLLLIPLFTGCAKKIPSCSNDSVVETVKSIIYENFIADEVKSKLSKDKFFDLISINGTGVVSFEENINKYSCEGYLNFNKKFEFHISYESYLHDETGEPMVSVDNINFYNLVKVVRELRILVGLPVGN